MSYLPFVLRQGVTEQALLKGTQARVMNRWRRTKLSLSPKTLALYCLSGTITKAVSGRTCKFFLQAADKVLQAGEECHQLRMRPVYTHKVPAPSAGTRTVHIQAQRPKDQNKNSQPWVCDCRPPPTQPCALRKETPFSRCQAGGACRKFLPLFTSQRSGRAAAAGLSVSHARSLALLFGCARARANSRRRRRPDRAEDSGRRWKEKPMDARDSCTAAAQEETWG